MRVTATSLVGLLAACGPSGLVLEPTKPTYAPGEVVAAELLNFTDREVTWGPNGTSIGLDHRTDGSWSAQRVQPSEVGTKHGCSLLPGGRTGRATVCTFLTTLAAGEAPGTYRLKVTVFSGGPVEVASAPFEVR